MKFWSRAVRILLATIVATQGAAFIPAMAASQSKRLAVKAIGIEELKSEFGAGGGGGGTPAPNPCSPPPPTVDPPVNPNPPEPLQPVPYPPEYELGATLQLQATDAPRLTLQCAPTPPPCAYNLDSDAFCDFQVVVVGYGHEPGSGQDTHQILASTGSIYCHANVAIGGVCTFAVGANLGLAVTGTWSPVEGVGIEASASVAYNVEQNVSIQSGWVASFGVVKRGNKYFGYKLWEFHDYDQYGNQQVTGTAQIRRPEYYYEKYVWNSIGVSQLTSYRL